jgi:PAS domain S-box-containing protein
MTPSTASHLAFADRLLRGESAALLALDRDGRVFYWNELMESITGISSRDAVGRLAGEVAPFLAGTGEPSYFARALAGETVIAGGIQGAPRGAEATHFEACYVPLGDPIGGVATIVREVTAQKLALEQLRETENRFQNMADASPVLLWMSGTDSLCTFFNQSWLDFTGRTLEEEWGVGWSEGVHFEDFQRCIDIYVAAFNRREVFEMEYRLRRRDGEYRWILDRGTPRYAPGGTFAGYIGSCVDITDRKRLEMDLVKAVRDRDDFLSVAAHELRTPLTTLRLEIETLQRSIALRGEAALASGQIARNVETTGMQTARLIALVENLLDVSRLASGRLELHASDFDLSEVVTEVVSRLRPSLESARCPVELALSEAIGTWDRVRIEQVATNLISNALKYGARNPIYISVQHGRGFASLEVRDGGIGIAESDRERIFRRFERATSGAHFGGFGVGLWIVREVVEAHGGSIEVESAPGQGATFRVKLPLRDEAPRSR